jgi:hypothetical protein
LRPESARQVIGPNGKVLQQRRYNFYALPDYDRSLGKSTLFYDQGGRPVGFYDKYNFDPAPFGQKRALLPELETRAMHMLGAWHGAKDYPIYYGEYVPIN